MAGCLTVWPSVARTADTYDQLSKLFEVGWRASQESDNPLLKVGDYKKAQEQFAQAKHDAPNDPRVDYAMTIVALQNNRLKDAASYLEHAPEPYPSPLFMRRLKVWLLLNRDDLAATQAGIAEFAHDVASSTAKDSDKQEMANWIGRNIGFYYGPGKNPLKADDLAKLDADVAAALTGPLAGACSAGQASVAERYSTLQDQLESTHSDAKNKNEKVREANKNKIAAQQDRVNADVDAAKTSKDQAQLDLAQKQSKLNIEMPALADRFNRLTYQDRRADDNLNSLKAARDNELKQPSKNRDTSKIDKLNQSIGDEEKAAAAAHRSIRNEIANVVQQQTANTNAVIVAKRQLADRTNELNTLTTKKNKSDAVAKSFAKQNQNPVSDSDKSTQKLDQEMKSITTYAPIDFAKDKQRILDSFHKTDLTVSKK